MVNNFRQSNQQKFNQIKSKQRRTFQLQIQQSINQTIYLFKDTQLLQCQTTNTHFLTGNEMVYPQRSIRNTTQETQLVRASPKKRILISPSKDLVTFFAKTDFGNMSFLNSQGDLRKLTLTRQVPQQKKQSNKTQLRLLTGYRSCSSSPKIDRPKSLQFGRVLSKIAQQENVQEEKQRFKTLQREIAQIRKKYSHSQNKNSSSHINLPHNAVPPHKSRISKKALSLSTEAEQVLRPPTSKSRLNVDRPIFKFAKQFMKNNLRKKTSFQHSNKLRLEFSGKKSPQFSLSNTIRKNNQSQNALYDQFMQEQIKQEVQDGRNSFQFTFGSMATPLFDSKNKKKYKKKESDV